MSKRNHRLHYMDMQPQSVQKPKPKHSLIKWIICIMIMALVWFYKVPLIGALIAIGWLAWDAWQARK